MPTTYYPRAVDNSEVGTLSTTTPEALGPADAYLLSTTRGATATSGSRSLGSGPTGGLIVGGSPSLLPILFISPRINAVTISGSITVNLRMSESAMTANAGAQIVIERRNSDGTSILATVCNSEFGTEMGTGEAAQNWSVTPTSTAFSDGDRIVVIVCANDAGGTMNTATVTFYYDGPTGGASGDSYVTFTETITEYTAPTSVPFTSPYRQHLAQ